MHIPVSSAINEVFMVGRSIEVPLDPADTKAMHTELAQVGLRLQDFGRERSFSWAEGAQPTRYSCWLAACPNSEGFVATRQGLEAFDGDRQAGQRGLMFFSDNPDLQPRLINLKRRADTVLTAAALAIGIPKDYLPKCSTRYRIIHYEGGGSGIGVHFDGNGLSAILTDQPGLREIGYDGQIRMVDPRAVSVMSGSSIYRMTKDCKRPLLPVFHAVDMGGDEHKTSMAAFWNFPDKTTVPGSILGADVDFYHDVGQMKNDDGPDGSLRYLWNMMARAHGITVKQLAEGKF